MKILVDTSIWSLAFKRKSALLNREESACLDELKELINEVRVVIIGSVRQEILSGIPGKGQFERLKSKLIVFKDSIITTKDYELAAEFYNMCRNKGVQGSHIDFLLCAYSANNSSPIFTRDNDFNHYKKHCHIVLHKSRF